MADVTRDEARVLAAAVHPQVGYLHRLRSRMEKANRKDDPLYAKICAAHNAAHGLWVHLHYRGCGVDRPPSTVVSAGPDVNTGGSP